MFICQTMRDIINQQLSEMSVSDQETSDGKSSLIDLGLWPDGIPPATQWNCDVTMATIKHHSAMLLHLVTRLVIKQGRR